MTNPTTPEAPEVSEEHRCDVCGRLKSSYSGERICGAAQEARADCAGWPQTQQVECLRLGYTREHERAEALAREILDARLTLTSISDRLQTIADESNGPHSLLTPELSMTEIEHALFEQRKRANEAEARAEGLAKELDAARAAVEAENLGAKAEQRRLVAEKQAATARVAEMQDRMVAAFGEGTDETMLVAISHEHEARVAELEKQLAEKEKQRQAAADAMLAATCGPAERSEWERLVTEARNKAIYFEGHAASVEERLSEAIMESSDRLLRATNAEAELARLRALPDAKLMEAARAIKQLEVEHGEGSYDAQLSYRLTLAIRALPSAQQPTAPTSIVHLCPPNRAAVTPCCGKTPFELPRTDRMTADRDLVTCAPAQPEGAPLNQCDGCRAGKPIDKNGNHRMGEDGEYPNLQACQKSKYELGAPLAQPQEKK